MENVTFGIDIGGTNTEIGLVTNDGKIVVRDHIPTLTNCDPKKYTDALSNKMREIMKKADGKYKVKGVGIGAPNGNFYTGTIDNAPNLGWGKKVPFIDLLKKDFHNLPFVLTNDANAAAMGEKIFGDAKNITNFIMLTLGTGVGSGIIINDDLVYGHDGMAGELGHITVVEDGRECGCGALGCLETYCSATGIVRTVGEMLAFSRKDSLLRDIAPSKLTSKDIYDAAKKGDELALETFEYTGEILGKAMANMVTFSSPECFFVFGGLAQAGDLILKPAEQYLNEYKRSAFPRKFKVKKSRLKGSDIAVLGAASVAINVQ